ncbi:MAG: polyphosphate:AMP phosphotransferase [Myxococcota bacterium]
MPPVFEAAEIGRKLSKRDYAAREKELRVALLNAQFDLRETPRSVIVLIAGDDRPGATAVLNHLHYWMDGRYLETRAFGPPTEAERLRPPFWRYWSALPRRGRVGVLSGSWALSPLAQRLEGHMDSNAFEHWVDRVNALERALAADGAVFAKLWIHLPKDEHAKRLAKAKKGRGAVFRIDENDWKICDHYDDLIPLAEELVEETTTPDAPWNVIEATDTRHRNVACAEVVLHAMEKAIADYLDGPGTNGEPGPPPEAPTGPTVLDGVDLTTAIESDAYKEALPRLQRRLFDLSERAQRKGLRTVLVFEGWDAADGPALARRVTHALDARDVRIVPMSAPTDEENDYHYLWRFWRHVPRAGQMVIFDRSWYGRVLVERVEGFASEAEWQRAYPEINEFERQLVEADTLLLKFWLHIDPDEQLRRFRKREKTPYKKHKITDEDYRNRSRWGAYVAAVHDMVERTSTHQAPWHLIPANDKRHARIQVLETLCGGLKRALKGRGD